MEESRWGKRKAKGKEGRKEINMKAKGKDGRKEEDAKRRKIVSMKSDCKSEGK